MVVPKDSNVIRGPPLIGVPSVGLGEYFYNLLTRQDYKTKTAVLDAVTTEQLTYEQLNTFAVGIAMWLQQAGVLNGEVVAVCVHNSNHYPAVMLGGFYVGATLALYSDSYSIGELQHMISKTKPKIVICTARTIGKITHAANKFEFVKKIVQVESFGDKPTSNTTEFKLAKITDPKEQGGLILCSSGTTGMPKGVLLTHHNIEAGLAVFRCPDMLFMGKNATHTLAYLPPFHLAGVLITLLSLQDCITMVVLERFHPELFPKIIQEFKIPGMLVVPPVLHYLAKSSNLDGYDLSSLERILCGAAPASKEMEDAVRKRYPSLKYLGQVYGMTETTIPVLKVPEEQSKPGSVGKVVQGTEMKIVDIETKKALGPNQSGELCIRGPLVMKGYIGDPTATAVTIDQEGWLHTGDIAYYDEEHWFYIVDRLKELIKYKGFQVPPAELEALLMTHPAVLDAAVIGVPDEVAGELPKAFIVQKTAVTEKEIQQFVASQVSHAKHLRGGIEFVETIPKTPSGKILRRVLMKNIQELKTDVQQKK